MLSRSDGKVIIAKLEDAFACHAETIYKKGYDHKLLYTTQQNAVVISLNGLQRFLDLPLEFYSAKIASSSSHTVSLAARSTCSGMLAGIIQGYGHTTFGDERGWQVLPRNPRSWAHCLAFLCPEHLDQLAAQLEPGDFRNGLQQVVYPVSQAIDRLIQKAPSGSGLLPSLGQYERDAGRLEISLELQKSSKGRLYLDVHCFLFHSAVDRRRLEESANRSAVLIGAPIRPSLQEWVEEHRVLNSVLVNVSKEETSASSTNAYAILSRKVSELVGSEGWTFPLTHNYASDFPLEKPNLQRYFRVSRPSVRNLLRSFERGTGIHLWCSVRRSGKTTAGFDLGSTTGSSTVVSQTCEDTGQFPDADLFYREFTAALDSEQRLSKSFFKDAVACCARDRVDSGKKLVFVLDEYETMFNQMRLAVLKDPLARYRIVQPLLNQMVEFSRDNLLLLIGLQPDSHYILMDQNQLSAYVKQDDFPLFEHQPDSGTSEFSVLLQRVLRDQVHVDPSFSNAALRGDWRPSVPYCESISRFF